MWNGNKIFHEKQQDRLCGQHCLNAALQGPFFTADDLNGIAATLDDEERERMAEHGTDSVEYVEFLNQPSGNMDDTGFFSVQVLSCALKLHNLELIPYDSSDEFACKCRTDPTIAHAFIFNLKLHWYCVRRFIEDTQQSDSLPLSTASASIGSEQRSAWFNLNSELRNPQFMRVSIAVYIEKMRNKSCSIFVIKGDLPPSQSIIIPPVKVRNITTRGETAAKRVQPHRRCVKIAPTLRPSTRGQLAAKRQPNVDLTKSPRREEDEIQQAIQESLKSAEDTRMHSNDMDLEEAIEPSAEAVAGYELAPSVQDLHQSQMAGYGKRKKREAVTPQQSTIGDGEQLNVSQFSPSQLSTALKQAMECLSIIKPEPSTAHTAEQRSHETINESGNASHGDTESPNNSQLELSAALQLSLECFNSDETSSSKRQQQQKSGPDEGTTNSQMAHSTVPSMPTLERMKL